jgi:hypothetical protein
LAFIWADAITNDAAGLRKGIVGRDVISISWAKNPAAE